MKVSFYTTLLNIGDTLQISTFEDEEVLTFLEVRFAP
jgi:hypothetical protein